MRRIQRLRERNATRLKVDLVALASRPQGREAERLEQCRHHIAGTQRNILSWIANHGLERKRVHAVTTRELKTHLLDGVLGSAGNGKCIEQVLAARRQWHAYAVVHVTDNGDVRCVVGNQSHQHLRLMRPAVQLPGDLCFDIPK